MANEKTLNARLQQKHDTEENWLKAVNFIPRAGEIIVYDGVFPRMKVGNGEDNVNDLPFINTLYAVDDGNGNVSLQYEGVETS